MRKSKWITILIPDLISKTTSCTSWDVKIMHPEKNNLVLWVPYMMFSNAMRKVTASPSVMHRSERTTLFNFTVLLPGVSCTDSFTAVHEKFLNYSHRVWLGEVCLITQCLSEGFVFISTTFFSTHLWMCLRPMSWKQHIQEPPLSGSHRESTSKAILRRVDRDNGLDNQISQAEFEIIDSHETMIMTLNSLVIDM